MNYTHIRVKVLKLSQVDYFTTDNKVKRHGM